MKSEFKIPQLKGQVPRTGSRLTYWLGYQFLKLNGWRYQGEFPNRAKMIIAVAPHTSNWDFFVGLAVKFSLMLKIRFLGKHTIFIPVVGKLLRHWGGIPVKRTKSHGIVSQLTDIFAQQEELVLCLSPEGTRKRIDRWKTGFVQIARNANVPVLLVGLDYKKKTIEIGPLVFVDEDIDEAMRKIYDFFSNINAKYPDSFYIPSHSEN
jgi:1-acyl-sn-glycerol-3-phosphate acyltransferase